MANHRNWLVPSFNGNALMCRLPSEFINFSLGKWAGDCFELTGDNVLQSRLSEEGSKWKDVGEESSWTFSKPSTANDKKRVISILNLFCVVLTFGW